ncbi:hypothetical protein BY458DRAFT_505005 [Sporodiniella umbellata]|nr:hypothetical protein BY458DRAFT_505005 [Sporodiniella umbellata]
MSKKQAKKLGGASSIRSETAKRPIYKSIVGSPFILQWPKIQAELSDTILVHLLKILTPIGEYRKNCKTQKKAKETFSEKPYNHHRIHIGINQVTRYLENHIEKKPTDKHPLIYVCKREIKPAQLCQHLLYMAAVANVKLMVLPADSELKLAKTLSVSKASVVLVEAVEDKEESLLFDAKQVAMIEAPWLKGGQHVPQYEQNYVKTIQTTIPIPNKEKRKAGDDQMPNKKAKLK